MDVFDVLTFDGERDVLAGSVSTRGDRCRDVKLRGTTTTTTKVYTIIDSDGCFDVGVEVKGVFERGFHDKFFAEIRVILKVFVNAYLCCVYDVAMFPMKCGGDSVWKGVGDFIFVGARL